MPSIAFSDFTWHDYTSPQYDDLVALQKKYNFHELDIEDCLSEHERPKIDEYEEYLFLVFHIPYTDEKTGRTLKEEVNIFLGHKFLVTIHDGNVAPLINLWGELKKSDEKRGELSQHGTGFFLYKLMNELFDFGFPQIEAIFRELRRIEGRLFEAEDEGKLLKLVMLLKRNIITMRSIILPQRTVVAALEHKNKKFVPAALEIYFDDILDAIERQWSLLETAKEIGEALQDTHESWIGHRTNAIIRVLTIFSVTMMPLTFITGLYGMNVSLPFAENPFTFLGILAGMMLLAAAFIAYFAWKKWL